MMLNSIPPILASSKSEFLSNQMQDKGGIWDRWKLEKPAFLWYCRGSPHVHTWIHIAHKVESVA
jgi:hypothetical protein